MNQLKKVTASAFINGAAGPFDDFQRGRTGFGQPLVAEINHKFRLGFAGIIEPVANTVLDIDCRIMPKWVEDGQGNGRIFFQPIDVLTPHPSGPGRFGDEATDVLIRIIGPGAQNVNSI